MLSRVALVLASVFAALFALEGVLLALGQPAEAPLYASRRPHMRAVWDNVEFDYRLETNAEGLRYRDIASEKPAGEKRVFVAGDSFTEGLGVAESETFCALLEKKFSAPGHETLFINGGIARSSPRDYARVIRHVGFGYRPDLVLVVLYSNDVWESEPAEKGWLEALSRPLDADHPALAAAAKLWPRLGVLVSRASGQWRERRFARNAVTSSERLARARGVAEERIRAWKENLPEDLVRAAQEGKVNSFLISAPLLYPDYWTTSLDLDTPGAAAKWRAMTGYLETIARLCRERGVPLAFVLAPAPFQYDPSFRGPMPGDGSGVRPEWTRGTALEERLASWMRERKLPYLNLAPRFRREAATRPGAFQFPIDGHWTPEGHRVAADGIAEWIETEKWPPRA